MIYAGILREPFPGVLLQQFGRHNARGRCFCRYCVGMRNEKERFDVDPVEVIVVALLETLVQQVGVPLVMKFIATKVPAEQAQALLDAEYAAARVAADAEAAAVLPP